MYAIFTTLEQAQLFADTVQAFLVAHRPGYNAEVWDIPQKHYNQDLWAVAMPPEKIALPEGVTTQNELNGWTNISEI